MGVRLGIIECRVLVADGARGIAIAERMLSGTCVVVGATSTSDALRRLGAGGISLVLCDVEFDDSRMFDLLRYVRAEPSTRGIPFLCVRTRQGELAPAVVEGLDIASRALGGAGFVDLVRLRRDLGEDAAASELRRLVADHLAPRS